MRGKAGGDCRVALALVVAASVAVGCGGDDDGDTTEPAPRGEFSLRVGELCTGFYARAAALQTELRDLNVTAASDERTRRRGVAIVEEIQRRSRQFLGDVRAVRKPDDAGRRQDAERLVASIQRFLDAQSAILGEIRAQVLNPRSRQLSPQELQRVQDELNAELIEQRALLRRLDISECLPAGS